MASVTTARTTGQGGRRWRTTLTFWLMVAPLVLGLLIFTFGPIVWGLLVSLFRSRGTVSLRVFVGLANYRQILTDPAYLRSLWFIFKFTIFIVPITYLLSLLLAVLVQGANFGRGIFRTIFFVPTAISYVTAAMIWRMSLFNGLPYGAANAFLWTLFKVEPITWIGTVDPPWHYVVLISVRLWLQVGFYMILFIAGMEDIPQELYEAARVDGAQSRWALFRHITFPLLRNTSIFILLMNIIHAFQAFAEFYNILGTTWTGGALLSLARPPLLYLYQVALGDQYYGRGTAGAFVLSILMFIATLIQSKLTGGLGRSMR